jgi:hypothetical protein
MTINFNQTFHKLLAEFELPSSFDFHIEIPTEIQAILEDEILNASHGITLSTFGKLFKASTSSENQSIIEDQTNHFHVDWHIESGDSKKEFMLGIKTLILLAEKFQIENIKGIRFWYTYQTPELAKLEEKSFNHSTGDDEYFSSDRLSFYRLREGENVISIQEMEHDFCSIMMIDI